MEPRHMKLVVTLLHSVQTEVTSNLRLNPPELHGHHQDAGICPRSRSDVMIGLQLGL